MMHLVTLRILVVAGVVAGLAVSGPGVAGQAPAGPGADVLAQLLTEVRGLRVAMEQMAWSGPRVQLALGRLQLQEQRVNTLLRRLDELREAVQQEQSQQDMHQQQLKQLEAALQHADARERQEAEFMIAQFKASFTRATADVQRLQLEESSTAQLLAAEQARWSDINRGLEELERALRR
jgi:chemotaxis protein histidine kinase CheA